MPNPLNVFFTLAIEYDFAGSGYSDDYERIENTNIVLANNRSDTEKFFTIELSATPNDKTLIKKVNRITFLDENEQPVNVLVGTVVANSSSGALVDYVKAELGKKYKIKAKIEFIGTDDNTYTEETNFVSFTTIEKSDFVEVDKIQIFLDNSTEFGKKFKSINIPMIPLVFKNETKMVVSKADLLKFIIKQDCINPLAYYEKEYVTEVFGTIIGKVETDYKGKAFYKGSDLIEFLKH